MDGDTKPLLRGSGAISDRPRCWEMALCFTRTLFLLGRWWLSPLPSPLGHVFPCLSSPWVCLFVLWIHCFLPAPPACSLLVPLIACNNLTRSSEPSCPQLLPCDPPGCSPPRISGFLEEQGWSWGEGGGQGSGGTRGMRPQPITPGSGSAPSPARHRLLTPGQPPGGGGLPQNPRQHLESTLGCPPRLNPMRRWVHHRSLQPG